jgi:hypothetical protein
MRSFVYDYPITANNKIIILQKVYLIENEDMWSLDLSDIYGQIPENKQIYSVSAQLNSNSSTEYMYLVDINQKNKDPIYIQKFNLSLDQCENIFNEFIKENSYSLVIKNCNNLSRICERERKRPHYTVTPPRIYIIDCPNINYTILENTLKSKFVYKYSDSIYPEFFARYISGCPPVYINGKKIYNIVTIFELENQIEELKGQVSTIPSLLNTISDLSERIKRLEEEIKLIIY